MARAHHVLAAAILMVLATAAGVFAGRGEKAELQKGLNDFGLVGDWNYDDIDGAFVRASRTGKPVCIVFR